MNFKEITVNHVYSFRELDRAAHLRQNEEWLKQWRNSGAGILIPLWHGKNLVSREGPFRALYPSMRSIPIINSEELIFLGLHDNKVHFTQDFSSSEIPPIFEVGYYEDLRKIGCLLTHEDSALLAYARGMCHWHRSSRFCPRCGEKTQILDAGHQKKCLKPSCGYSQFPRTDPAVIMLVHDGKSVVLGRQEIWPEGMHSLLAGYVEPGESLEDTVIREVQEEVGIIVNNPQYQSSQPWPFPSSLMLGFTAVAGEEKQLVVNTNELESARWCTLEELQHAPENDEFRLPRKDSIARKLLDEWIYSGNFQS